MSKYKTVTVYAVMETDCYAHLNVPKDWDDEDVYRYAKEMDGADFVPCGDWAGDWRVQPDIVHEPYNPDHFNVITDAVSTEDLWPEDTGKDNWKLERSA